MDYATDKFLCIQVSSVLCSCVYRVGDFVGSVHHRVVEKSSIFPEFASTASEKSEERTPQAREHVSGVHCFLQLSHPSPCKSHQQVNWRPCHSIFLIHYTI